MYGSTMDALIYLYPKLSIGGYIIVDDYGLGNCKKAINNFRQQHNIDDLIIAIDTTGIYWKKTK
jgi:O-methyltransferase